MSEWNEICRLGRVFPKLEALVLAECPLKAVEAIPRPVSSSSDNSDTAINENEQPPHAYFKYETFSHLALTATETVLFVFFCFCFSEI